MEPKPRQRYDRPRWPVMEGGRPGLARSVWAVGWNRRPGAANLPPMQASEMAPGRRTSRRGQSYLVSRTEQARDRRIAALRRWIVDAVDRAR